MRKLHRLHRLLQVMAVLAFASVGTSAWCVSSTCTPFVDVSSSATYCQATQWLAARSISVGCTDSTHYCPNDAVTRASMALLLNRTAIAIAPTFLHMTQVMLFPTGADVVVCQTSPYSVTGFNRVLTAEGMFYFSNSAGPSTLTGQLVYSLDGGGSWNDLSEYYTPINASPLYFTAGNSVSDVVTVQPGANLVVGVAIDVGGQTTISGGCEVRARLENFNYGVLE